MKLFRYLLALLAFTGLAQAVQPTLVSYGNSTLTDNGNVNETVASRSWQTGDIVLVFGAVSENAGANLLATPTITSGTGTGLTFTLSTSLNNDSAFNDAQLYLWTATAAGTGSGTVQSVATAPSGNRCGIFVYVYRGTDGLGTPVSLDGSTAKTISVTRAGANSHVAEVLVDYLAVGDVVVDATPTGTVQLAQAAAGQSDFFALSFSDQGATGTTSYGITNHTGTVDMSGLVVEVKGTAGGGGGGVLCNPISGRCGTVAPPISSIPRHAANEDVFLLRASR